MKTQAILVLAVAVLAAVMLVGASQDEDCRKIAANMGLDQQKIDSVKTFKLYGQPRSPKTCKDQCEGVHQDVGFDYFGKQACCCGNSQ